MAMDTTSTRTDTPPEVQGDTAPVISPAPLPMIKVEGPEHQITFVNPAFCRLVGKQRGELVGKAFAEIVSADAGCLPLLDRVYKAEESEAPPEANETEPNPAYWLDAIWPTPEADARPTRVIIQMTKAAHSHQAAIAVNEALLISGLRQHEFTEAAEKLNARLQVEIAERKRAEQALLEAQERLRNYAEELEQKVDARTAQLRASVGELESFSYCLVHDLREPVRAIHGFNQLVLEMPQEEVGPAAAELLKRAVKAAIRMDSLIQDVLALGHVIRRPITLDAVDVDALVQSLVGERPELSLSRADIKIESPLLRMRGHEAALSQCLTNLLSNAVKFVDVGVVPRVRVWTEERMVPALHEGKAPNVTAPSIIRLWIEDNGIGIAAEAHQTIFEIFQRLGGVAHYEGSGIGLAIVRKATERMGGRAGVESEPGKGSRFWLELPKG